MKFEEYVASVREFHEAFTVSIRDGGDLMAVPPDEVELRRSLTHEEQAEVCLGLETDDPVETADGLADLLYITAGTALQLGTMPTDADIKSASVGMLEGAWQSFSIGLLHDSEQHVARSLIQYAIIVHGIAALHDIPLDAVFEEVHRSNMTKGIKTWRCLHGNGDIQVDRCAMCECKPEYGVLRRADGKILKPLSYSPADIAAVLALHAGPS